ncbi:MAG: hypothetical protein HC939_17350 [Pleurocapsa sp. SU_5_0]|jgi:hypothetical protein|nr:hypothetical protein [Pleurocapsa sp. SU_5_0]NJO96023.1 hypothetical protein [Pleurocapsa sp. CRU_1_2]NJR47091.1 hypothetical protein [Hyellaceae cyanobacterium CSU_1_1]
MNKILTALGCSGSVAISLLGANSVGATEYIFTAPEMDNKMAEIPASKTDYPFADCSCDGYDADTAAEIDRQGDKAIQLYGCDCAGCRNLVRNLNSDQPQS